MSYIKHLSDPPCDNPYNYEHIFILVFIRIFSMHILKYFLAFLCHVFFLSISLSLFLFGRQNKSHKIPS